MAVKVHGISVILHTELTQGEDPFGEAIIKTEPVEVANVLVAPASAEEITNGLNLSGRRAVYTLGIPKGDTNDWENKRVDFFGDSFRTFGAVVQGIDDLIPLAWNKKVMCERYE